MSALSLMSRINHAVTRRVPIKPAPVRFERPAASLTFDDFPRSAWTIGGPILARWGAKATYYAAGRFCGITEDGLDYYDADDLRAVAAAGHEIGCHSFGHLRGTDAGSRDIAADLDANIAFLRETLGDGRTASFAYPYGDASVRTKRLVAPRFATCRGIYPGVNRGWTDLAQLKAAPLEKRSWNPEMVEALVEDVRANGGWLIFFSHDVSDDPSPYGATPAMLDHALKTLAAAGIASQTVKAALAAGTFGDEAAA